MGCGASQVPRSTQGDDVKPAQTSAVPCKESEHDSVKPDSAKTSLENSGTQPHVDKLAVAGSCTDNVAHSAVHSSIKTSVESPCEDVSKPAVPDNTEVAAKGSTETLCAEIQHAQSPEGDVVECVSDVEALQKQFDKLLEEKPFLNRKDHFLHHCVEECRDALGEQNFAEAEYALDTLVMELKSEERIVAAAFKRFDNHKDHQLSGIEIEFMMDYLGFPCTSDDISRFVDIIDKNDDDAISFDEFIEGVGRMGGSAKLFEVRRLQIGERTDFETAVHDKETLRKQLQACGIQDDAQHAWEPVTSGSELDAVANLNPCQKSAVRHIRAIAQTNHEQALPGLLQRVSQLGFCDDDLWMCLAWIRELSPIIVHTDLDKLGKFLREDTHYRNQFETNTSSGLLKPNVRTKWERSLFGLAYDDAAPFDRPKYGVQNVWNDYRGVLGCKQYGDSYLVLKDIRLRCTLSPCDSANLKASRLAVLDYYAHVLQEYTDKELLEALRVAEGGAERVGDSAAVIEKWGKYKEAQIHGEIDLKKHVERLVVSERHRTESAWIEELARAHGWKMTWSSDMKSELESRSGGREMSSSQWKATLENLERDTSTGAPSNGTVDKWQNYVESGQP